MSAKADPVAETQDIFLQKDETANMILDNVFGVVDEQIDLAEARIRLGGRPGSRVRQHARREDAQDYLLRPDRGATPTGKPWSAMTCLTGALSAPK